jgi:hypothetical protein
VDRALRARHGCPRHRLRLSHALPRRPHERDRGRRRPRAHQEDVRPGMAGLRLSRPDHRELQAPASCVTANGSRVAESRASG